MLWFLFADWYENDVPDEIRALVGLSHETLRQPSAELGEEDEVFTYNEHLAGSLSSKDKARVLLH